MNAFLISDMNSQFNDMDNVRRRTLYLDATTRDGARARAWVKRRVTDNVSRGSGTARDEGRRRAWLAGHDGGGSA